MTRLYRNEDIQRCYTGTPVSLQKTYRTIKTLTLTLQIMYSHECKAVGRQGAFAVLTLQIMYSHECKAVGRQGAFAGAVDLAIVCPDFEAGDERPHSPVHC